VGRVPCYVYWTLITFPMHAHAPTAVV
jgi:hypothetical protein